MATEEQEDVEVNKEVWVYKVGQEHLAFKEIRVEKVGRVHKDWQAFREARACWEKLASQATREKRVN